MKLQALNPTTQKPQRTGAGDIHAELLPQRLAARSRRGREREGPNAKSFNVPSNPAKLPSRRFPGTNTAGRAGAGRRRLAGERRRSTLEETSLPTSLGAPRRYPRRARTAHGPCQNPLPGVTPTYTQPTDPRLGLPERSRLPARSPETPKGFVRAQPGGAAWPGLPPPSLAAPQPSSSSEQRGVLGETKPQRNDGVQARLLTWAALRLRRRPAPAAAPGQARHCAGGGRERRPRSWDM